MGDQPDPEPLHFAPFFDFRLNLSLNIRMVFVNIYALLRDIQLLRLPAMISNVTNYTQQKGKID